MYHLMLATSLHPFAYDGETFNAQGGEYSAVPVISELLVRVNSAAREVRGGTSAACTHTT